MTSRRSCASEEVANTSMNSVWMSCVGALGADEYQELRFATSSNAELLQETVTFKLLLRVRLLLGGGVQVARVQDRRVNKYDIHPIRK